jgi:hypothetical protein
MKHVGLFLVALLIVVLLVVPFGCGVQTSCLDDICIYHGKQPPYGKAPYSEGNGGDNLVHIVNNPKAIDPTWEQLKSFLTMDDTDEHPYLPEIYMCADFAEEIQNNAEAAGIRAAFVTIDFEDGSIGHALNAFNTSDRGLFYIDCTGPGLIVITPTGGNETYDTEHDWDKAAYIEIGEPYGIVSLDVATCPEYSCYEAYEQEEADFETRLEQYNQRREQYNQRREQSNQKLEQFNQEVDAYNSDVDAYNSWIEGKVFYVDTPEYQTQQEWYARLQQEGQNLDTQGQTLHTEEQILDTEEQTLRTEGQALDTEEKSLGTYYEPLGTVSRVRIYWP